MFRLWILRLGGDGRLMHSGNRREALEILCSGTIEDLEPHVLPYLR